MIYCLPFYENISVCQRSRDKNSHATEAFTDCMNNTDARIQNFLFGPNLDSCQFSG